MFGTIYRPILSTLAHFDHFKRTIKLVDFNNCLKVFNHKSHLRLLFVYWYMCVRMCVRAAVSAGLSLADPACLS